MDVGIYMKKPYYIEAIQWDAEDETLKNVRNFLGERFPVRRGNRKEKHLLSVSTPYGAFIAFPGDYILRHNDGTPYMMDKESFKGMYFDITTQISIPLLPLPDEEEYIV